MQLVKRFTGKVSGVAFASMVATGVSTAAPLTGCVALESALRRAPNVRAPGVAHDPNQPWPENVPGASFALLWPQMVYQRTDASCSVAAVTVVVNALRAGRHLPPVAQEEVVATNRSGRWWRDSQNGGPGMDLGSVHLAALTAAAALGDVPRDGHVGVQAVVVPTVGASRAAVAEATGALAFALGRMVQAPAQTFVLVNFKQSELAARGEPEGHFGVVGAYDEKRQRVLVLDVDQDRLRPYWVTLAELMAAMAQPDDVTGEPRGYLVLVRDR